MFLVNFAWLIPLGRSDDDDGPGLLGMLLIMILGPLAAAIIQLADQPLPRVPGRRLRRPAHRRPAGPGLRPAQAGAGTRQLPLPPEPRLETASHMMIANPFRAGEGMLEAVLHPPADGASASPVWNRWQVVTCDS